MIPFSVHLSYASSVLKLLIICSRQCLSATHWTAFNLPLAIVRLLVKKSMDQKSGINHVISSCQARNGQHAKMCIKRYNLQAVPTESEIFDKNS